MFQLRFRQTEKHLVVFFVAFIVCAHWSNAKADASGASKNILVGEISSAESCTVYEESSGSQLNWGSSVAAVNRYGGMAAGSSGSYSTWKTWLVKDCVDNFASLRAALRASLAGVGHAIQVVSAGNNLTLSGTISDLRSAMHESSVGHSGGVLDRGEAYEVTVNITLKDQRGRVVYGQSLNTSVKTAQDFQAGGVTSSSTNDGKGIYAAIEKKVALAVARSITFHFDPPRVQSVSSNQIILNYGAPLFETGDLVQIILPGAGIVNFHVVGSVGAQSVAEVEGRHDLSAIKPGAEVAFIEVGSPAANSKRFERVELP